MKTKLIAPWNLKPGMSIVLETVPRDMARNGNPRAFPVRHISKGKGTFTGSTVWHVRYNDPTSSLGYYTIIFHGLRRSHNPKIADWQADKVLIEVKPQVKATVTPNGIKFKLQYA